MALKLFKQKKTPAPSENKPKTQEISTNLTSEKPKIVDPVKAVSEQKMELLDVIAPSATEIDMDYIKINNVYLRSLFVSGYPRFVSPGWLEQVVNFNSSLDISFFIYPIEGKGVLDDLMRKVAEMEAEIATDLERGKIINPATQARLDDARLLQDELVKGANHWFASAFGFAFRALAGARSCRTAKQVESTLG